MAKSEMKTVDIKGKPYVTVNERIMAFREAYPGYALATEIIDITDKRVVMKAEIIDPEGKVLATGHAYEMADSSYINKTSYIENCETSAWGRALGNFGIGIDGSMCSAEEITTALINQGIIQKKEKSNDTPAAPVVYATTDELRELRDVLKTYSEKSGRAVTISQVAKHMNCTVDKFPKTAFENAMKAYKNHIARMEYQESANAQQG